MTSWMIGRRLLGSLFVVVVLTSACTPAVVSTPDPSACDGISAEIGGCDPDQPTFTGTTCAEVGAEWGTIIGPKLVAVIDGPKSVNDRSIGLRMRDVMILAFVRSGMHLDSIGKLESCTAEEYLAAAEPEFSDELRARAGEGLYDGDPVGTWDQFIFEVKRVLKPLG